MEKGILKKTGKPLAHWIEIVEQSKISKHKAIIEYLKSEHGFTHGFANFVALKAKKSDAASIDDINLITNQYRGKEHLKPIYDLLVEKIKTIGDGIEIVPKKANVSIKTKKQFSLIQPSTKTRLDVGLKLRDTPTNERLQNSGIFGAMCTHRVEISTKENIDKELMDWLTEAYRQSL